MVLRYLTGRENRIKVALKVVLKRTAEMLLVGLGICLVAVIVFTAIAWAVAMGN